MCRPRGLGRLCVALLVLAAGPAQGQGPDRNPSVPAAPPVRNLLTNGGFERGLVPPWGIDPQGQGKDFWWNSSNCLSAAELDETVRKDGEVSLHIANLSRRAPQVYGTVAQRIPIKKHQLYRITLWAKGNQLASRGAMVIIVDRAWKVRPILLPAGTYAWRMLEGVFSLPEETAEIRILSEDVGEAWIDDIRVVPIEGQLLPPAS